MVTEPARKGFGSRLILQVLPYELSGKAELKFEPSGVIFALDTTIEAIRDKPVVDAM